MKRKIIVMMSGAILAILLLCVLGWRNQMKNSMQSADEGDIIKQEPTQYPDLLNNDEISSETFPTTEMVDATYLLTTTATMQPAVTEKPVVTSMPQPTNGTTTDMSEIDLGIEDENSLGIG